MRSVLLLVVQMMGMYSITTDTQRGVKERNKRTSEKACNPFNIMRIMKENKNIDINISESFFDRIYKTGNLWEICNNMEVTTRETENQIYVINNLEQVREKRDIDDQEEEKEVELKKRSTIDATDENIRMIERLAVKIDELQTKIDIATAVLETQEIKSERKKFLLYKTRVKDLLKLQLQTAVQKHMAVMEEYERILLPDIFHR